MRIASCRLLALSLSVPLLVLVSVVIGDAPAPPPISKFAPAEDLLAQVDSYVTAIREALVDTQVYAEKSRIIARDANTLAALGLVLAMHDQDHRLKGNATALVAAAQTLSKAKDYKVAKEAYEAVEDAATGEASPGGAAKWERVAGLGQLMKQVTFVNNRLKRNIRRFKERADDNARDAAVLAAIAQVCNYDTHEVKDQADIEKWYQWCGEMRDAAGDVNAKVHAGDQAGAEAALGKLAASCESCHQTFRVRTSP